MTEVLSLLLKMTDNKHENSSPSEKQTARLQAYCDVLEVGYHTHTHTHAHTLDSLFLLPPAHKQTGEKVGRKGRKKQGDRKERLFFHILLPDSKGLALWESK